MITRKVIFYLAGLMMTAQSGCVFAGESSSQDGITAGAGAQYASRYSGSDEMRLQPVMAFEVRKGAFFADSQKGIGYDLQSSSGLYFEHTLGYSLGRSDRYSSYRDGSDKLEGMGNISPTVNTALVLGWSLSPWLSVESKAVVPLSDYQGLSYQASIKLILLQGQNDTVTMQTDALFGDARYMNTWYGVTDSQSQNSGFSRYDAPGGFYGKNISLAFNHQFNQQWSSLITAGYTLLEDRASNSPIVFRRNEGTGMLMLSYIF